MRDEKRELMKHDLVGDAALGQPEVPPFVEAPDAPETLRLLAKVSRMPDIRFDKVQRMKELMAAGKLETPERIDGAAERMIEELGL